MCGADAPAPVAAGGARVDRLKGEGRALALRGAGQPDRPSGLHPRVCQPELTERQGERF